MRLLASAIVILAATQATVALAQEQAPLFLPLVRQSSKTLTVPILCRNYAENGGFEFGGRNWLAWESVGGGDLLPIPALSIITEEPRVAHNGRFGALLGEKRDVVQMFTMSNVLPTRPQDRGGSGDLVGGQLRFWLKMSASDGEASSLRSMIVMLLSTTDPERRNHGLMYFDSNDARRVDGQWRQYEFEVTEFLIDRPGWRDGAQLSFVARTQRGAYDVWMIDDVELEICYRR